MEESDCCAITPISKAQLNANIWHLAKFRLRPTELVYVAASLRNFSKPVTVGFDNHKGS